MSRLWAMAHNQFGASLGLDAHINNGWSVGGEYRGTYARKHEDHAFFLRVALQW